MNWYAPYYNYLVDSLGFNSDMFDKYIDPIGALLTFYICKGALGKGTAVQSEIKEPYHNTNNMYYIINIILFSLNSSVWSFNSPSLSLSPPPSFCVDSFHSIIYMHYLNIESTLCKYNNSYLI